MLILHQLYYTCTFSISIGLCLAVVSRFMSLGSVPGRVAVSCFIAVFNLLPSGLFSFLACCDFFSLQMQQET